jgi:hypothetical protein
MSDTGELFRAAEVESDFGLERIHRCGRHSRPSGPQYRGCECKALVFGMMRVSGGMTIVLLLMVSDFGASNVDLQIPMSGFQRRTVSS